MDKVTLEISKQLRVQAMKVAKAQGFTSLSQVMEFLLEKFTKKEVKVEAFPAERLSPKAARRLEKMSEEIRSGKVTLKTYTNVKDLMHDLNS